MDFLPVTSLIYTPRFGETMNLNASFLHSRLSIARSHGFYRHRSAIIADSFRQNNDFELFLCIFMFILLALCIILARLSSSYFSPDRVFRRRRSAKLLLDLSAGRKQPFAIEFHPICHFSATFIAAIAHIHPELRFFQTHSQFSLIPPGLLLANKWPPMILTGPSFYCRRRTRFNLCILLLLIIGGVEVNPGPSSSVTSCSVR